MLTSYATFSNLTKLQREHAPALAAAPVRARLRTLSLCRRLKFCSHGILDMRTCTGVPLSVRTAIRVEELHRRTDTALPASPIEALQPVGPSLAIQPVEKRCLEPVQRNVHVQMRMVEVGEYLPTHFRIPHFSCEAAWRAWWMVTDSLPLPLRFCAKKLPKGPNHAAECTRFSRIKKARVMMMC
jgi:hypothetical protein